MPSNSEHIIIGKGVDYLAQLVAGAVESFDGRFDEDCTAKNEQVGRVRRRGRSIGRRTYLVPLAVSIDCRVSARVERADRTRRHHATAGTGFNNRATAVHQDHRRVPRASIPSQEIGIKLVAVARRDLNACLGRCEGRFSALGRCSVGLGWRFDDDSTAG
jgi:hypothetical protein